jgi:uncharacterized membrane protein
LRRGIRAIWGHVIFRAEQHRRTRLGSVPEQFQEKWEPAFRSELRQGKTRAYFRLPKITGNTLAAFLFIFAAGSFIAPEKAHADFRVCNTTQNLVGVALGYRAKTGWITEGWWHVNASSCTTLVVGPLTSRYYYLYAEDAQSGGRWDGKVNMCVAENQFKITGINDCFARGFQRAGFQEYDTGEQTSWMVQLTEENPPSSPIVTDTPPQ